MLIVDVDVDVSLMSDKSDVSELRTYVDMVPTYGTMYLNTLVTYSMRKDSLPYQMTSLLTLITKYNYQTISFPAKLPLIRLAYS